MHNDELQIFMTLSTGITMVRMLADLGGLWLCLWHRSLSNWLLVAALGFAGIFISSGLGRLASYALRGIGEWMILANLAAVILGCLSMILLVFGLGAALFDIRKKLSRSQDPSYARR